MKKLLLVLIGGCTLVLLLKKLYSYTPSKKCDRDFISST